MKALILKEPGASTNFHQEEMESPALAVNEVLIRVKAISINPVDVKTRQGYGVYNSIKGEKPLILGWDIAGVVTKSTSDSFRPGDEVFGMINFPGHGKAYAEYVVAPAGHIALKPPNISFEAAAATTLAALTAYQAMVRNANVLPGQKILIHAAAGGVGHFAVQIAKQLGAHVVGTSSAKNRDFVLNIGADEHIDYQKYNWNNVDKDFDFVLDTIGGDNIDISLEALKSGGTLISIPSGLSDAVTSKAKERGVNGYFMLVKSNGDDMRTLAGYLKNGVVKPHISRSFPFDEMSKAHDQVESGRTVGKAIVTI